MSNAEQIRTPRRDAKAFADAFAGADDAFTAAPSVGESRTLTLAELSDVLDLDAAALVDVAPPRPVLDAPVHADRTSAADDDALLTLDELGAALAQDAAPAADVPDFDFGSRADERARRRTAARLGGGPTPRVARRRSGPAATPPREAPDGSLAEAAAQVADRLAVAPPVGDVVALGDRSPRPAPLALVAVEARRADVALQRPRDIDRRPTRGRRPQDRLGGNPDRIALWAVLLGILLVVIAASSSSADASAAAFLLTR